MFSRFAQIATTTSLALGLAAAPTDAGDGIDDEGFTTDRQVVWERFFEAPFEEDGGFLFFDEMVVEPGATVMTNGTGMTMELDVVDVKHYDWRTAATTGLFDIDGIRFILENQVEYSLITARARVGDTEGLVLISSFGGFILSDSPDWLGFGWTLAASLPAETVGFASAPDPCGGWSLPRDHTWPLPPEGDSWCDSFNTLPCDLQEPPNSLDVVDLDCFDEAYEDWKKGIDTAVRQHGGEVDAAKALLETCLAGAEVVQTGCIDRANANYDYRISRISRQKMILGIGSLAAAIFATPVGGLIIGGGAMAASSQLDDQEREAAAGKLASIRGCDKDFQDAKDACEDEYETSACSADESARTAVQEADDAFLATLGDCCTECGKTGDDIRDLEAVPGPGDGFRDRDESSGR
ncbi:MAG: hypothetical protein GY895_02955 [Phycisphaera sp.]|nr:hypothetical protein [Phycisphaera sp.]